MSSHFRTIATAFLFTSIAIHIATHRRQVASEKAQYEARFTLLEDLLSRLRDGQRVEPEEIENVKRLTQIAGHGNTGTQVDQRSTSWREVFLGRKTE